MGPTTIEQTKGSILRSTTWEKHWDDMSFKMGFILQQNWTKEKKTELNKVNTGSLPWRVDSLLSVGQTKLLEN